MRDEVVPGAALFKTSGVGMAWPGAGAQGHRSRADVMYFVSTVDEVRAAVADYVRMKPEFIKFWVDDRDGRMKTLPPELYRAITEESHKYGVPHRKLYSVFYKSVEFGDRIITECIYRQTGYAFQI